MSFADDEWATVEGPGGRIDFQTAPGHLPPTWPDPRSSMQMHLDFYVEDLAEAHVLAQSKRQSVPPSVSGTPD